MKEAPVRRRMTRQRRIILETLRAMRTHPTAEELFQVVRQKMPRISLGTVYRNLDVLCRSGQVLKLDNAGQQAHYDGDVGRHYHIRCVECGKIEDLYPAEVSGISFPQVHNPSYQVLSWTLLFEGICPDCAERVDQEGRN
ncbi:MAG TPA: transcriptional repressor [Candidatus Hydrogenedentes bacterium]|mgnify:CR=1 FL=1|nr:transcriptional repressor [Candidatus Hydrogenedentota bacterium]HOK89678.1 transcriptional repressor [Candidatus Hydrogenedentota bacterium]HOV60269.1 transcriptional repressor [Candidatus Hydrogenedentota bacterium]